MALPSTLTLGSLAFVVAAGAGLIAVSTSAGEEAAPDPKAPVAESPLPTRHPPGDKPPGAAHVKAHQPPRQHRADVVPKTLVDVYNNSGISGLAADKSAFLQGAGWNVSATDNWYGNIADNTVYYPAKLKSQARDLAKALEISRLRPAVSPMQFDRLTVIFTSA